MKSWFLAMAVLLCVQSQAAEPLPTAAFANAQGLDMLVLSPDGSRLAATISQEGKRALFSPPASATPEQPAAAFGAVVIDCGRCGESTVLSPGAALHHVVPSLHLPFIKPKRGSWMQCPACRHRTWVSVQIRL